MNTIKPGTRLTILVPAGKSLKNGKIVQDYAERSGKVVMRSATGGWVLNMGGRYGTPGLADETNIVKIGNKRIKRPS